MLIFYGGLMLLHVASCCQTAVLLQFCYQGTVCYTNCKTKF